MRRARNRAAKSALKTQIRKVREAASANEIAKGEAEFRIAVKKLDQAAAKKIIHKNSASRTKSRLAQAIRALG